MVEVQGGAIAPALQDAVANWNALLLFGRREDLLEAVEELLGGVGFLEEFEVAGLGTVFDHD